MIQVMAITRIMGFWSRMWPMGREYIRAPRCPGPLLTSTENVQILFIAILIGNFIVFSIEIKGAYLCQFIYADTLVYYNLLDLGQYIDGGWS